MTLSNTTVEKACKPSFFVRHSDLFWGAVFLFPTAVLFIGLIVWPFVQAILLSFQSVRPMTLRATPVGLDNYREVLATPQFWNALGTNFVWLFGSLALQIVLGIAIALLLNRQFAGRAVARAVILFPYMLPAVVAALAWQWMLNDLYGVVNAIMLAMGLPAVSWLGEMPAAMVTLIVVGSWKVFPFVVIAILARLQSIPQQLYDAAAVDGAGNWHSFWDVTLPQLRSVLVVVVLLRAIWDFKEFDMIFLLTGGGPAGGTTTLPILVYRQAFELLSMGKASAVAVLMLIVLLVMCAGYFLALRRFNRQENLL